jgi:hypothetical protein
MIQRILMALVLAGLTAVAGAETVYKWTDSTGQIHYTDLPPRQADAKILGVFEQEVGDLEDESSDYEGGDDYGDQGDDTTTSSGPEQFPDPPPSNEAIAASKADAEKLRVEHCKMAQARYKQYTEARRLFRETNGQRVYLTDKELTDARAKAKQTVDDYCS